MEIVVPQAAITDRSPHSPPYQRRRPEQILLSTVQEQKDRPHGSLMIDAGAYLLHGTPVTREFGIPAVANLAGYSVTGLRR
jgi:hypothetical protein